MQFFIGLIIGAALLALVMWLQHKEIRVKWYEWFLGGLGFLMLLWTIHDFFGSMAEYNETAAHMFLLLLGVPALVLLALAFCLPWWRWMRINRDFQKVKRAVTK